MYTLFLIGCVLAVTLCPLLLDAILTHRENRITGKAIRLIRRDARFTLASTRVQ